MPQNFSWGNGRFSSTFSGGKAGGLTQNSGWGKGSSWAPDAPDFGWVGGLLGGFLALAAAILFVIYVLPLLVFGYAVFWLGRKAVHDIHDSRAPWISGVGLVVLGCFGFFLQAKLNAGLLLVIALPVLAAGVGLMIYSARDLSLPGKNGFRFDWQIPSFGSQSNVKEQWTAEFRGYSDSQLQAFVDNRSNHPDLRWWASNVQMERLGM